MPAKVEANPALPGLSPVCGRPIIARFDGGQLASDAGVLALREIESRLGMSSTRTSFDDPLAPRGPPTDGARPLLRRRLKTRRGAQFAAVLYARPKFGKQRSPRGVEAFVRTLKRDYARIQPRGNALTLLQQLAEWMRIITKITPHSGLRMQSLREFMNSQCQPAPCPA